MTVPEVETARGLVERGRVSDAIRVLQIAEAREPRNADVLLELGSCYSSLGMPAMAVEFQRRATMANPTATAAWTAMGENLMRIGDLSRSQGALRRALDLDPGLAAAAYALARVAAMRGDTKDAKEALQRALSLHPEYREEAEGDGLLAKLLDDSGLRKPPKRRRT